MGVGPATVSRAEQWCAVARGLQAGVEGPFPPFAINNALESMCGHDLEWSPSPRQAHDDRPSIPKGRRLS